MQWALVDSNGIVKNIIEYDGVLSYSPPSGLVLQQVNWWLGIGQNINTPNPNS